MSFLQTLFNAESRGGQNVAGPLTSSGQAQGYYQITTGTWNQFASPAILSQYPTPMSAPFSVQSQVASAIPMGRWDPTTLSALRNAGYGIDPNMTLGQNAQGNNDPSLANAINGFAGAPAGSTTDGSTGLGSLLGLPSGTQIQDWVTRGFLIVVGVTIVAFGLWHLVNPATAPSLTKSAQL